MITILLGFVVLAMVIIAMAIGVLMGRKPISGSCGGVGAALGEKNYECDICGGDPHKCDERQIKGAQAETQLQHLTKAIDDLSYDATKKHT